MQIIENKTSIAFSGDSFCFTVGKNGKALSLRFRGEELLSDSETSLFIPTQNCVLRNEIDGDVIETKPVPDGTVITIGDRRYLKTDLTDEEIATLFKNIRLV